MMKFACLLAILPLVGCNRNCCTTEEKIKNNGLPLVQPHGPMIPAAPLNSRSLISGQITAISLDANSPRISVVLGENVYNLKCPLWLAGVPVPAETIVRWYRINPKVAWCTLWFTEDVPTPVRAEFFKWRPRLPILPLPKQPIPPAPLPRPVPPKG